MFPVLLVMHVGDITRVQNKEVEPSQEPSSLKALWSGLVGLSLTWIFSVTQALRGAPGPPLPSLAFIPPPLPFLGENEFAETVVIFFELGDEKKIHGFRSFLRTSNGSLSISQAGGF